VYAVVATWVKPKTFAGQYPRMLRCGMRGLSSAVDRRWF
jgi:hypothetical protein